MLYLIRHTHADTDETTEITLDALNARDAHTLYRDGNTVDKADTVRAFPRTMNTDGTVNGYAVMRMAISCAKKSAEKTLNTDTQNRIALDLTSLNHKAGERGAEERGDDYLLDLISRTCADAQNLIGAAYDGIMTALTEGQEEDGQAHAAFLSINAAVRALRAATEHETSLEYITESGGSVVELNRYISRLFGKGERYFPMDGGTMDAATAAALGDALTAAAAMLTPRQKEIARYIATGHSVRQTAEHLNIKSAGTVDAHLANIRDKYRAYLTEHAPRFLSLIKEAETATAAAKRRADRYTAEERAAYMRDYRARKAAAKRDADARAAADSLIDSVVRANV